MMMQHVKLGRLPGRYDPRTLRLDAYLIRAKLPTPPPEKDWLSNRSEPWPMFGNDRYGDCTCSSAGHAIINWTDDSGLSIVPTDEQVLAAYGEVTGFDPQTGANDRGAVMLDVLNHWRQTGIAGRQIKAFAKVNPADARLAIYLFGSLYVGVALPRTAQTQDVWDVAPWWKPGRAPWSWGGHAICVGAYDSERFGLVTWGARKWMTEAFFRRYGEELWAILTDDWINANTGMAANGLNMTALEEDLAEVTK